MNEINALNDRLEEVTKDLDEVTQDLDRQDKKVAKYL
jgi:hypothetical protein